MSSSDESEMKLLPLNVHGLPSMSQEQVAKGKKQGMIMVGVIMVVPRLVAIGIGYLIFKFGNTSAYRKQCEVLGSMDLGYLFAAVFVFCILVQWVNTYPMLHKAKLGLNGNIRANMQFFEMIRAEGREASPYVVFAEEGAVGEYNRANRSLTHLTENMGGVLLCILAAGYVFPFPTLVCTLVFAVGRVAHQIGYSIGGYGKHAAGFAISALATEILEALVLWAALASFRQI